MPYSQLTDLPRWVQHVLPKHWQEIYLAAFNNAWQQYRDPKKRRGGETREEVSHKVAWFAVERVYQKNEEEKWVDIRQQ